MYHSNAGSPDRLRKNRELCKLNPGQEVSIGTQRAHPKAAHLGNLLLAQPVREADQSRNPARRMYGQYYKVENDLKFEYYTLNFEVETGMLTRIGYHWQLEGFRAVDGVMVPARVVQGRKGGSTNLYFDTVTHGAEVADHLQMGGNKYDE
jgi:hypothetical protein